MKGKIGLVLLLLGIVIAASFGSRNGDRHSRFREASAKVAAAEKLLGVLEDGRELNKTLKAEGTDLSKLTMEEHIALMKSDERMKKQVEKAETELKKLRQWGMAADQDPALFHHLAEAERDAIGLPDPRERLMAWFQTAGVGWLVGVVLIIGGAVLARLQVAEDNAGTGTGSGGRVDFMATMAETQSRLRALQEMIAELPMDAPADKARLAIDALGDDVLNPLVEGRGQLIARHGLAGFAEYFGPFSAGERNVNRAWSALTDGHSVVAREALENAVVAFESAEKQYGIVEGHA